MNSKKTPVILIVDDIPDAIMIARHILERRGYSVLDASNGSEALKIIEQKQVDLILLDIMMPDMDGFELCERLKENEETASIPIIFVTSKTDLKSLGRGFEMGAVDYILKPYKRVELLARVKTHLALQHTRDELEAVNKTKDKFFSIIAHDLRNPFSALRNFLTVFKRNFKSYNDNERLEFINDMESTVDRINRLLENLLMWSRVQTGRIDFNPETLEIGILVEETILLLKNHADDKNININSNVNGDASVHADRQMILTVLRNLISNSIKFTRPGGKINIEAKKDNRNINISVEDTGRGIAQEDIPKLFKIDVSYSTTGTAKEQGTGLGLILCKEFIELHGGNITVESKPGLGSTFSFSLPK